MNKASENSLSQAVAPAEPAMSDNEVQATLRRQLVGSAIAAVLVVACAGVTAARPDHRSASDFAPHHSAVAQAPTYATPFGQLIAWKQQ